MKKVKRILAFIGVGFFLSLYLLTFIGAVTASPHKDALFMASLYSTIVVPIMAYAYILVYRILRKYSKDNQN